MISFEIRVSIHHATFSHIIYDVISMSCFRLSDSSLSSLCYRCAQNGAFHLRWQSTCQPSDLLCRVTMAYLHVFIYVVLIYNDWNCTNLQVTIWVREPRHQFWFVSNQLYRRLDEGQLQKLIGGFGLFKVQPSVPEVFSNFVNFLASRLSGSTLFQVVVVFIVT